MKKINVEIDATIFLKIYKQKTRYTAMVMNLVYDASIVSFSILEISRRAISLDIHTSCVYLLKTK